MGVGWGRLVVRASSFHILLFSVKNEWGLTLVGSNPWFPEFSQCGSQELNMVPLVGG